MFKQCNSTYYIIKSDSLVKVIVHLVNLCSASALAQEGCLDNEPVRFCDVLEGSMRDARSLRLD